MDTDNIPLLGQTQEQKDQAEEQLTALKSTSNALINTMYDEIAEKVLHVDKFMIPAHGIPNSDFENPTNLFKRQLKIEELSFELAHKKYQKSLNDLIKIGKADQLATSHRYIISWMRTLEKAINEQ